MTEPGRKTYDRLTDVQTQTRDTARAWPTVRVNTLGHESTVLAGLLELNEDTRLLEADIEKYWDAPSTTFRDLDAG